MQVKDIITDKEAIQRDYSYHPHARDSFFKEDKDNSKYVYNAIYVPTEELTFAPEKPGYGLLKYDRSEKEYDFDKKA